MEKSTFTLHSVVAGRDAATLYQIALFPWNTRSIDTLWGGHFSDEHEPTINSLWPKMCREYGRYFAVGGTGELRLYETAGDGQWQLLHRAQFPSHAAEDVHCVVWSLSFEQPYDPLVVVALRAVLHVFDVRARRVIGSMRGHGEPITSLSTHPIWPQLVLSTSRDHTVRVWDLSQRPRTGPPHNPAWPGLPPPTLAGPPHGLAASEPDGTGTGAGACVALLMGGRAGGHQAAVSSAAWYPGAIPLVATCGVDRSVKIWRLPELDENADLMATEDKPVFSSAELHAGRVISVTWLGRDLLMTHSASTLLDDPASNTAGPNTWMWREIAGTLCIWRWTAFDRFFPGGRLPEADDRLVRGDEEDYQGSSDYEIVAEVGLPMGTLDLTFCPTSTTGPFIILARTKTATQPNASQNMHAVWHISLDRLPAHQLPAFPGRHAPADPTMMTEERKYSRGHSANELPLEPDNELRIIAGHGRPRAWAVARRGHAVFGVGEKGTLWTWTR